VLRDDPRNTSRDQVGEESDILSRTPSTTCAVVDLRTSQVRSPAWRTVLIPPLAARSPLRAWRFKELFALDLFAVLALPRRFEAAFRAGRFLADDPLALLRFLALRFLVAAIWSLNRDS
jgi:hypothetical protein